MKTNDNGRSVWFLGSFESSLEAEVIKKGYTVKKFPSGHPDPMQFDDQPAMVFFTDITPENSSLFMKINQFFPGTLVLSLPNQSKKSDTNREQSIDRLILSLMNIKKAS